MAQVILVTSGRGGAGKSTVCAYLGAALAACGKKVLLIEGSHRSLDVLLGAQDRVVFDLADALERRCELGEAMVDACGVRLLCAPLDLQPIIDGRGLPGAAGGAGGAFRLHPNRGGRRRPGAADGLRGLRRPAVIVSAADAVSARAGGWCPIRSTRRASRISGCASTCSRATL